MKTRINRGLHGSWQAETWIPLDANTGIRLSTRKVAQGALVTSATRMTLNDGVVSYMMFRDFHKIYLAMNARVTQNAVKAQHDEALSMLDKIKSDCAEFYSSKQEAA